MPLLQEGRDPVKIKSCLFLGLRRVLLYAQKKLDMTFWKSWLDFHQCFPKGKELLYAKDLLGNATSSWPHPWQREAWENMALLFDGMADEPLQNLLSGNVFAPAEVLLQDSAVKKVFDLDIICAKKAEHEAVVAAGLAKAKEAEVSLLPETEQKPQADVLTAEKQQIVQEPEDVPEKVESPLPEEPCFWAEKFPDLVLPSTIIETLSSAGGAECLEKLHAFASSRL